MFFNLALATLTKSLPMIGTLLPIEQVIPSVNVTNVSASLGSILITPSLTPADGLRKTIRLDRVGFNRSNWLTRRMRFAFWRQFFVEIGGAARELNFETVHDLAVFKFAPTSVGGRA
jgi:hypothetical protein